MGRAIYLTSEEAIYLLSLLAQAQRGKSQNELLVHISGRITSKVKKAVK